MKNCTKCDNQNTNDSRFCVSCGNDLEVKIKKTSNQNHEVPKENIPNEPNKYVEMYKNLPKNQKAISIFGVIGVISFFLSFVGGIGGYTISLYEAGGKSWFFALAFAGILALQYMFLIQQNKSTNRLKVFLAFVVATAMLTITCFLISQAHHWFLYYFSFDVDYQDAFNYRIGFYGFLVSSIAICIASLKEIIEMFTNTKDNS